ncbi:ferredoxin-thioredoxin reductase, variable chain-like [Oryza brachyantha]|uniref:ferredoxin-thioredoxin reductase, variable chain-like n=1 Tax=Oryza brachyantha TaxID=4533 RepID=UPI001ADCED65|nr:ferredoxin-thioredoxin reductase, variable chain-like [Oryza brachyantha]
MATTTAALAPPSTSTSSVLLRRRLPSSSSSSTTAAAPRGLGPLPCRARLRTARHVALTSDVSSPEDVAAEEAAVAPKIGKRVRVTAPLRVYHVMKAPDLDIEGMEGVIKQYVAIWKGKRITANFPFKVEFNLSVEGQPKPVRFFVHLREDEFEFIDE